MCDRVEMISPLKSFGQLFFYDGPTFGISLKLEKVKGIDSNYLFLVRNVILLAHTINCLRSL